MSTLRGEEVADRSMTADTPKLRLDLDIIPAEVSGQQLFVVRDSLGLIKTPVAVNSDMLELMRLLDGNHTKTDLGLLLTRRRKGVLVLENEIDQIIEQLDEGMLLETDRCHQARKRLVAEFAANPLREPVLAGLSYPAGPDDLKTYMDNLVAGDPAPGTPPSDTIKALAAPHIDLSVGEKAYAAGYLAIRELTPDLIVVLGTGHTMEHGMFCPTEKDLATPFGTIKTDKTLVRQLRTVGGKTLAEDDLPHRREHAIEIQLVFLQYVFRKLDFRILPILCGSIAPHLSTCERFTDIPDIIPFLSELKQIIADTNSLVVAGVDFSHIGQKFGDSMPATAIMKDAEAEDRALIESLCRHDAGSFWEGLKRVEDRYHVCGASSLACLMEIVQPCRGTLLEYNMWHEEATRSAVAFASIAFSQ